MKKIIIAVCCALTLTVLNTNAQNLVKNSDFSGGWLNWDYNCYPEVGGIYPYTLGSPYWFEDIYGGPSSTNLVAEVAGGLCISQQVPVFRDLTYRVGFKASRRCQEPDTPDTVGIVIRALGIPSFWLYTETPFTYTNTVFSYDVKSFNFTIPSYAPNDASIVFSASGYNNNSYLGVILDSFTLTPALPFTVNAPSAALPNTGTNWSVSNLPTSGVSYTWSFPGATPSSSTLANPTNIQWSTTGLKVVTCVLSNGTYDVATVTKSINITTTLPVHLLSFNAEAKNAAVALTWVTTNEVNTDYFEVYRSKNTVDWELVGKVNSIGTNGGSYALTDPHPVVGFNYYRLKQFDKGGTFTYSNVVKVSLNGANDADMYVYPTIVKSSLTYVVQQPKSGKMTVMLSDISGRRISKTTEYFSNGSTQRSLDVSKLASGVYLITVMDESNGYKKSVTFNKN